MDIARYGDWATGHTRTRRCARTIRGAFAFDFRMRNWRRPARCARRRFTKSLRGENAVFGDYCGLEHALWFAPKGTPPHENATFRRSNAHAAVGEECRAVRESVGLLEISNYGKFEVTGAGAAEWLGRIMACRVPAVGRIALSPMLNERGRLIGDFTLCRVDEERFFVVGTYAAEVFYMRWFERRLPPTGVTVRPCAMQYLGLSIAGPQARALLSKLVDDDLSTAAFPFMSFARMDVGMVPTLVGRVSFTGDLGYEIWVTTEYLRALYDLLTSAGRQHGIRHYRRARAERAAPGEKLRLVGARVPAHLRPVRGRPRPVHTSRQARFHRSRCGARRESERRRTQAHHAGRRCEGCRCDRGRADLAQRARRRVGYVGRLRAQRRQVDCAWLCRKGVSPVRRMALRLN